MTSEALTNGKITEKFLNDYYINPKNESLKKIIDERKDNPRLGCIKGIPIELERVIKSSVQSLNDGDGVDSVVGWVSRTTRTQGHHFYNMKTLLHAIEIAEEIYGIKLEVYNKTAKDLSVRDLKRIKKDCDSSKSTAQILIDNQLKNRTVITYALKKLVKYNLEQEKKNVTPSVPETIVLKKTVKDEVNIPLYERNKETIPVASAKRVVKYVVVASIFKTSS
ncbi:MAG: hypothetical protein ABH828_00735 [archaeon]